MDFDGGDIGKIDVPYCFASIARRHGRRFLYRAKRTVAIPSVPRRVLAKGVFRIGRSSKEWTAYTFGGRHFENFPAHWQNRHGPALTIQALVDVLAWRKEPEKGANDHPFNYGIGVQVKDVPRLTDRFIPPDWHHFLGPRHDDPILHRDTAPIYSGGFVVGKKRYRVGDIESFQVGTLMPLSSSDDGEMDVREADKIAAAVQRTFDSSYVAVEGELLQGIKEPCIRVLTTGLPGAKVYLEHSHYFFDYTSPLSDIVVYHRLDDREGAQRTAEALASSLGSKAIVRGRLDYVDGDALYLDGLATTVTAIAPRFSDLIDRSALIWPDEVLRAALRMRRIWTGDRKSTERPYACVSEQIQGQAKADGRIAAWLDEWRRAQVHLGRPRATTTRNSWLSRLLVANDAMRLADGGAPAQGFTDIPAAMLPQSQDIQDLLETAAKLVTFGSKALEAWLDLRRGDGEATKAIKRLRQAGDEEFRGTDLLDEWNKFVVPVIDGTLSK